MLSKDQASRYYSVFIFYSLFLSLIACEYLTKRIKAKEKLHILVFLSVLALQTPKTFSGFRNNYVSDLQDIAQDNQRKGNNKVFVYQKENKRLTYGLVKNAYKEEPGLLIKEPLNDLHEFYIKNSFFNRDVLLIIPESKQTGLDRYKNSNGYYLKTGQFITNKKHNRYVATYWHKRYIPHPDVDISLANEIANWDIKAFIPEYETYIYKQDGNIVWLIGNELNANDKITYFIHTDFPDQLPEPRKKHRFDNRSFKFGSQSSMFGKYTLFHKKIPDEYPVKAITCGLTVDGVHITTRSFRISDI